MKKEILQYNKKEQRSIALRKIIQDCMFPRVIYTTEDPILDMDNLKESLTDLKN